MEPADDMQLDGCSDDNSWAAAAVALAQDVTAVLQGTNDGQACEDALTIVDLCVRANQSCMAAASCQHSCMSAQTLPCLAQLTSSTMQLASAVFCQPDIAMQLLTAGSHARAADNLKATVKELTSHLTKCLEAAVEASGSPSEGREHQAAAADALQGLLPALQAAVQHLLHMALTLAAFIAGTAAPAPAAAEGTAQGSSGSSSQLPKEMRSMAVLNLAWTHLTKLLLAVPAAARQQVLQPAAALSGFQCALQQLQRAVQDMPQQAPEKREVVARFWMQNVIRLMQGVISGEVVQAALVSLLEVTTEVYQRGMFPGDDLGEVQDFLTQVLQPRLVLCLASLLSGSPEDEPATQAQLECLLTFRNNTAAIAAGSEPNAAEQEPAQEEQLLQLQVHLLVVLDLMQQLPTSEHVPLEVLQQASCKLLAWALRTAGCSICGLILGQEVGGALLQHVLQACLAFLVGCMAGLAQQQQQELLSLVTQLSLSEHPLVAFLAQQLLADALSCATTDLLQLQLGGLLQLLQAAASCSAAPNAHAAFSSGADALVNTMAAVLQACDEATAAAWLSEHHLPSMSSSDGSGGGSNWLDAGSCCLLACHCNLLVRMGQVAAQANIHPFLEEHLSQLWLAAQQVLELLGPPQPRQQQQQQQAVGAQDPVAGSEQLLVLHLLTWHMEAMKALLQLQAAQGDTAAVSATSTTQCCTALALDVLKAVHSKSRASSNSFEGSSSHSHAAVRTACTAAALKVLAAAGHVVVQEEAEDLLEVLQCITAQHQSLHVLMAAVVGNIGVPAGSHRHEELFQMLLSSPHWSVRHAAFEGLLTRLRYNTYNGSGIVRLLPASMRASSTEAAPAVIQVVKAHLHRTPDPQAQQAHQSCYQQIAKQHSRALAVALSDDSSSSSSLPRASIASELAALQHMLASCSASLQPSGGAGASADELPSGGAGEEPASRSLQALLQLACGASCSLEAVEKALSQAEGDVRLLMSAATAAAQGHELAADEVMLVSRQGARLVGSCASMCSRLRALQDSLACLKS